jgi:hypothetical protein
MPQVLGIKNASHSASLKLEKQEKLWARRKTFRRTYYVLSDDVNQTEDDIVTTTGIPPLFSALNGAFCVSQDPKENSRVVHPLTGVPTILWEVDCKFDSNVDVEQDQPPEAKPPVLRWYGESEEEVLEKDLITEDPIRTDAEEPLIVTTQIPIAVLEIKRYEFYPFDPDIILNYGNHVNTGAFYGAPLGTALMMPPSADEETIEGVKYVSVTYRVKFKIRKIAGAMQVQTWKARVLHVGYKFKNDDGKIAIYEDKDGNPAQVFLINGTGKKKATGADPDYKEFNRYPWADFNALNLGPF